ncbi:MAG: hypothetical protein GTN38_02645 [Candidatus Aenigmarchaeota archaeon]|nr:hypothetical protein [Candidatus Aenigmarchaeota archaeon]NIP40535.1 hypothetical protein [Candidatus Aenigmarchaeota archaeon]NIQ18380.1 hypothetical protein [Candidatus Aenigmarchaeota archaeon]
MNGVIKEYLDRHNLTIDPKLYRTFALKLQELGKIKGELRLDAGLMVIADDPKRYKLSDPADSTEPVQITPETLSNYFNI